MDPNWMGDQQSRVNRSKSDILKAGGCTYPVGRVFENGDEWHPRVYSHGEVKSVKCHCKVIVIFVTIFFSILLLSQWHWRSTFLNYSVCTIATYLLVKFDKRKKTTYCISPYRKPKPSLNEPYWNSENFNKKCYKKPVETVKAH